MILMWLIPLVEHQKVYLSTTETTYTRYLPHISFAAKRADSLALVIGQATWRARLFKIKEGSRVIEMAHVHNFEVFEESGRSLNLPMILLPNLEDMLQSAEYIALNHICQHERDNNGCTSFSIKHERPVY